MNTAALPLAVIGGGIIGLTAALALQRAGVPTVLLEAEYLCAGASWGNAGHIATEQVFPVADWKILPKVPKMLLDPLGPMRLDWRYLPKLAPWALQTLYHMRPAGYARSHQALCTLNRAALPAWQRLLADIPQAGFYQHGHLLVAEQRKTAAQLRCDSKRLSALGIHNDFLDAEALHALVPALSAQQIAGLHFHGTAHIADLPALARNLALALRTAGGKIFEHWRAAGLELSEDSVQIKRNDGEILHANAVLIAAGAFSKPLVQTLLQQNLPLDTERGYHLMLPKETGRLPLAVASADRRFIMTPMVGGLRLAGTVEYAGLKAPANMVRAERLLPHARALLADTIDAENKSVWMGFRPTTADSLPVIDRPHPRVLLAFGHQHLGLTHAPLTAEILTALYFARPSELDLSPFRLARFARR